MHHIYKVQSVCLREIKTLKINQIYKIGWLYVQILCKLKHQIKVPHLYLPACILYTVQLNSSCLIIIF